MSPAAGDRRAQLDDIIRDDLALTTGIKSRSELLFQDKTLSRLGPESYFSFKTGTRDMTLQRGTLLLQVPKGIGGATIHTAAVTAAITGTTILIEYRPQKSLKVLVLEGSLRLSNGRFGDSLLLTPGKMVIMPPNAKRIPDPVTVDLKKVVNTSNLVNMGKGKKGEKPLPSVGLIAQEIDNQQEGKNVHNLIETNLVIMGKGTNVQLTSADVLRTLDQRMDPTRASSPLPPTVESTPVPTSGGVVPGVIPGSTPGATPSSTPGATPSSTPGATPSSTPGGTPGSTPSSTPAALADVGPTPSVKVHSEDNSPRTEVRYGDDGHPITSPVVINTAHDYSQNGGTGSVKIASNDSVTFNSLLKVSDTSSKKGHGEISVKSGKTSGSAIVVSSSAQLLALLSAAKADHGTIMFQSAGGDIKVSGTVQADHGSIEMRNDGDSGLIALNNATLNASTIKVGALGKNGTLNIGGGSISADTLIKLYAGGANGTVNFTDNVSLNGDSVKNIAGDTVTIFNGKVVTVHGPGPANVFTNHPNYTGFGGNGSTTGTFGGQGATTQPFSKAPGW
ncbi:MAG TPA: FecR domain-containing protein [Chthoniobacterales bacterium]